VFINYLIGPAGSGKTTLTKALFDHIHATNREITCIIINLDPGVKRLPYQPHIDVREYVDIDELMTQGGYGPNGALVAATDRLVDCIEDIKFEISEYNYPEIILVDTPGQLELFAYRSTGPMVASALGFGEAKRGITFLFNPELCIKPNGFLSTMLLAASVQFRFPDTPQMNLLTKIDLLNEETIEQVLRWAEDSFVLENDTMRRERGMMRELTLAIHRAFEEVNPNSELLPISAKTGEGIAELFGQLMNLHGEDLSEFY
jgi:GTPase SAR1 family protein